LLEAIMPHMSILARIAPLLTTQIENVATDLRRSPDLTHRRSREITHPVLRHVA
jgi:hypothetical protein